VGERNERIRNKKRRIFLNASLSSQAEQLFNKRLKRVLTKEGFECLLPQEVLKPGKNVDSVQILKNNMRLIESCDIVLSVLDKPGEGVIFELGVAFALNKPIIILRSDEQDYLGKIIEGLCSTIPKERKAANLEELRSILKNAGN